MAKLKTQSLKKRESELANTKRQLDILSNGIFKNGELPTFAKKIAETNQFPLKAKPLEILQINVGYMCNQVCDHCHVDAGPDRKEENMSRATLEKCLEIIGSVDTIHTVDITGGAPEMNPHFKWFVEEVTKLGKKVINRCNLTIIMANKKYQELPAFFKKHKVHLISSLPYFSKSRTDSQRGDGVFEDSIKALQLLNEVGYGQEGSDLTLDLVYNPSGAFLPAAQETLQAEFKRQLKRKYDIVFNSLFCITNLPVSRFLDYLLESGNYSEYMQKLVDAFNPMTVEGLMCRNTISVSWEGYLYDCDFNQMLDLKVAAKGTHLDDFNVEDLQNRAIVLNQHCYGCTAGAGSSCGGEIT